MSDREELVDGGYEEAATEVVVNMSRAIGLGALTEDNIDDWFLRLAMVRKVRGPYMLWDGKVIELSYVDLKRRIGIVTNVVDEPYAEFLRKLVKMTEDEAKSSLRGQRLVYEEKI